MKKDQTEKIEGSENEALQYCVFGCEGVIVAVWMYCFRFAEPPSSKIKEDPLASEVMLEGLTPKCAMLSVVFQVLQVTTMLSAVSLNRLSEKVRHFL